MTKTVLVTGGGRGLGRGLALALARQGHRVVLTARDPAAHASAVAEIQRQVPGASVEGHGLDLASFAAIRAFAHRLDPTLRFDAVVHVAGVLQQSHTRRSTVDGHEETLAVNALAPFLLTHELLARVGGAQGPGRVVCVSSRLHLPDSRGTPVHYDFADPELTNGYDPDRAYKNSKLAVLWFAFELARRASPTRVTVHAVCPGFVPETAWRSTTGPMRWLLRYVMPLMPFATRFDDAVDALAFTAVDPSLDTSTGVFWAEKKPFEPSRQAQDPADARRFWQWAETVTGAREWPAPASHS